MTNIFRVLLGPYNIQMLWSSQLNRLVYSYSLKTCMHVHNVQTLHLLLATYFRCPMKPFFIEIQNFWAWTDQLNGKNSGAFGVIFSQTICTYIGTIFSTKTKALYQHSKYLFQFGLQRIRDLAFVCPQSVSQNVVMSCQKSNKWYFFMHFVS